MMILVVDEERKFEIVELTTKGGRTIKIGDELKLETREVDNSGSYVEAGTRIKIKKILIPPRSVYDCAIFKGEVSTEIGRTFSGSLLSFGLK